MSTTADLFENDPLQRLRAYRGLAPWSLRDVSALASAILEASRVYPINAAARPRPSERTIRFYVSRGLVTPPEGKGTAAIYVYRHLLQVLAIKLRQMEGATLETIRQELSGLGGDVIERRVAAALGGSLPRPTDLAWRRVGGGTARGRGGGQAERHPDAPGLGPAEGAAALVRRIPISPGCELLIAEGHPLLRHGWHEGEVASRVRRALAADRP